MPQFTAVTSGYSAVTAAQTALSNATTAAARLSAHAKLKAAWASLDIGQRHVVRGMIALSNQFQAMFKTFEPGVLKIFNMGLKDAKILLPDVFKIAKAAAPAIMDVLKRIAKDAALPQFQHFLTMMAKDAPHAIKTAADFLFGLARAVINTARFFGRAAHDIKAWMGDIWRAVTHAADNVEHAFDHVQHALRTVDNAY